MVKKSNSKWRFAIDRGGTFTDLVGIDPRGRFHTAKLLSSSPEYVDPSIEIIRRVLGVEGGGALPAAEIESIRFGTTVATNALLERRGGRVALFITKGFGDLLEIGFQARPNIFALCIKKPTQLYERVVEVEERMNQGGRVVRGIDLKGLEEGIGEVVAAGIDAVAVVFLHSWVNPEHEIACGEALKRRGVKRVFLSHQTMNCIKAVTRGQSAVVDAYLSPVIESYIEQIEGDTEGIKVEFMESSGGLSHPRSFMGKDALFSGPAGGLVAVATVAGEVGSKGVIGFDMGGTSTDVSRFDGRFERVHEQTIGGIELQKESLHIVSVASGGGSILWFDGQRMRVGPESAAASPGPACYGFGGPLTVTDANLMAGRISPDYFPATFGPQRDAPLNTVVVREKFSEMAEKINRATGGAMTPVETALGFLTIANEVMARAIREISVSRGFDVREYSLMSFGGAGGQHACSLASMLDMREVIFHPLSGLMSACGIGVAIPTRKMVKTLLYSYTRESHNDLAAHFDTLEDESIGGDEGGKLTITREVDIRPIGADAFITVTYGTFAETMTSFIAGYRRLFGFSPEERPLEVVNLRVEAVEGGSYFPPYHENFNIAVEEAPPTFQSICYREGVIEARVYRRHHLTTGTTIEGPAVIVDPYSSFIIDSHYEGEVVASGAIIARSRAQEKRRASTCMLGSDPLKPDPIMLEVFHNLFMGVAVEMGHALRNTAHSVNIKERNDFSCAVFNSRGDLIANAPHIPVHLGSMADTVQAVLESRGDEMELGDIYLTNNPYRGGSHLPDMTVVCPIFSEAGEILFFTAARGHHADIGGTTPGSMPPVASHIDEEGILIDDLLLVRGGEFREGELTAVLTDHPYPVRNLQERIYDIKAQIAACRRGERGLMDIVGQYGWNVVDHYMEFIQENGACAVRQALARFLGNKKFFTAAFEDFLDDGTPIRATVSINGGESPPDSVRGVIDFTGTGPYHEHDNLNAPLSVTRSAVLYFLRTLTGSEMPLNSGCLRPIDIIVPVGSILKPSYPASVASGNVETSQRVVDVLLGAMKVAAASQGTMNNILLEVEGGTPYYETIAGGAGATDGCDGASGVQVHMTNTRITDPEVLEQRHPQVRLEQFRLRKGSGGAGQYRGGEGVVREIRFLKPAEVTIISERRRIAPYGMEGGGAGKRGANLYIMRNGEEVSLPHRAAVKLGGGGSILIETPGGGGYGKVKG
ncbi:MAG: hydantoinase B/oxoprolinase family protein [Thermodesulfobacteriota bacterium]